MLFCSVDKHRYYMLCNETRLSRHSNYINYINIGIDPTMITTIECYDNTKRCYTYYYPHDTVTEPLCLSIALT